MASLVFKLLLKMSIPLLLLVGALSYGLYMQGGDPAAVVRHVAGGAVANALSSGQEFASDAATLAAQARGGSESPGNDAAASRHQSFYTWVDADGVTHYTSEPPGEVEARRLSVDSQQNLVRAVKVQPTTAEKPSAGTPAQDAMRALPPAAAALAPAARSGGQRAGEAVRGQSHRASTRDTQSPGSSSAADGVIPGMAGIAMPAGPARDALIKMLK